MNLKKVVILTLLVQVLIIIIFDAYKMLYLSTFLNIYGHNIL